jgi:hypothetical protein
MRKILTATLAVAIALAPAAASAQGRIGSQQSYVTGSKPATKPGNYKVVKVKKAKAVHHKRKHSYTVAKAPHYAKHSYYHPRHHHHHWHGQQQQWLLPALVGTAIGLGLFRFWH